MQKATTAKINFDETMILEGFTAAKRAEIKSTMGKMGIQSAGELVRKAVLEYAQTIMNNPERWKYDRPIGY